MKYYYKYTLDSKEEGLVDKEALRGVISPYGTFIRRENEDAWFPIEEVPELSDLLQLHPSESKSSRNPNVGADIVMGLGIAEIVLSSFFLLAGITDWEPMALAIGIGGILTGTLFIALSSHFRNTADIRNYLKKLSEKER